MPCSVLRLAAFGDSDELRGPAVGFFKGSTRVARRVRIHVLQGLWVLRVGGEEGFGENAKLKPHIGTAWDQGVGST